MIAQNIAQAFDPEQDFVDLMFECRTNQNKMDHFVADGFETARDLLIHHKNNTETICEYLKLFNKAFNQHPDPTLKLCFPYQSLASW